MARQFLEFRLREEDARRYLPDLAGKTIGSALTGLIRRVKLDVSDSRLAQVGAVHRQLRTERGNGLLLGWTLRFRYSAQELDDAEVLRLVIPSVFEPAGEETGTLYEYSDACRYCGFGRRQVSDLFLDLRPIQPERDIETQTIPKTDIARTIADEVVVSARLADVLASARLSGFSVLPVYDIGRREPSPHWKQLILTGAPVRVVEPTRFGIDPFDDDSQGEYRCPLGHVAGLNLLSELTLDRSSWGATNVAPTSIAVGLRQGLLVPSRLVVVDQTTRRELESAGIKGADFEIAHLAN